MPDDPYRRVLQALRDFGSKVVETGQGTASVQCPVHGDNRPSATVSRGDRQPVVFDCRAQGCSYDDMLAAVGLDKAEVGKPRENVWTRFGDAVAIYQYRDETRQLLYEVCRTANKDFPVRVPDPGSKGGYRWKLGDARRVLYRLPELLAVEPGSVPIYLVEGEKDVHAVERTGNIATTAMNGAQGFAKTDPAALTGHYVYAVVDRPTKATDTTGEKWATAVEKALRPIVKGLKFIQAKTGKDAHDHLSAGHTIDDFEPYVPPAELVDYVEQRDQASQLLDTIREPPPDTSVSPEAQPEGRIIRFRAASGIRMTRTRWLHGNEYGGHIPVGAITLLAGREGIGKSTISYDVIAKVSLGTLRGEFFGTPKGVVIYATEDDWEPVILPRLVAAGADTTRVFRADAYDDDGAKDWLSFPRDLVRLAEQCLEHDVALLVLDPIMSIIDGKLDTHKDREVRQALDPLSRFAAAAGVAVCGLIHVNKSSGSDALNSVMGSRAFSAVARSVLYCIAVPKTDDEDGPDEYLFSQEKCNLGPKQGSQRYQITTVALDAEDEDGEAFKVYTSKVTWGVTDSRRAGDVMEEANKAGRAKGDLRTELAAWLREQDDMVPVREIHDEFQSRAKRGSIDMTLSRMVAAGEIERPVNGMYRALRKAQAA